MLFRCEMFACRLFVGIGMSRRLLCAGSTRPLYLFLFFYTLSNVDWLLMGCAQRAATMICTRQPKFQWSRRGKQHFLKFIQMATNFDLFISLDKAEQEAVVKISCFSLTFPCRGNESVKFSSLVTYCAAGIEDYRHDFT